MKKQPVASYFLKKGYERVTTITLASAALIGFALPAQAANINFTYGDNTNAYYRRGAEAAGLYWSDFIEDNVTINIHLDIASANDLPNNVLGGAIPAFENDVKIGNFYNALKNDRKSDFDYTAFANLPVGDGLFKGNYNGRIKYTDEINLTRANAKALGLINPHHTDLDGVIVMSDLANSNYRWETMRSWYLAGYEFDYTSVLIHEIGHLLGFVNATDSYGELLNIDDSFSNLLSNRVTPFNLYTQQVDLSSRVNSSYVAHGRSTIFSINGGSSSLGSLSTGIQYWDGHSGDDWQTSHWKYNIDAMMNPALAPGQRRELTSRDLQVFDVLGWDVDYNQDFSTSYVTYKNYNKATSAITGDKKQDLENMLIQYRWGGASSGSTRFRQDQDLADYLAQEGLFQAGTFWSHMPTEAASVPEPTSSAGLFALGLLGFVVGKKPSPKS